MDTTKTCTKCNIEKSLDSFHRRVDGLHGRRADCIECRKSVKSEYYQKNREHLIKLNVDGKRDRRNGIYKDIPNEEEQRNKRRSYIRNYLKGRRENDQEYKLSQTIRSMLHRCFNGSDNYTERIGYTTDQLKKRLELNFKDGMSWDNYGEWVIDHKKPLSLFLKQGIDDPKLINMLSNLQPLWYEENATKGSKFKNIKETTT